jgi:hypothetical protein
LNPRPPGYEFPFAHAGRYRPVSDSPSHLLVRLHGARLHAVACHPVIRRWVASRVAQSLMFDCRPEVERGCLRAVGSHSESARETFAFMTSNLLGSRMFRNAFIYIKQRSTTSRKIRCSNHLESSFRCLNMHCERSDVHGLTLASETATRQEEERLENSTLTQSTSQSGTSTSSSSLAQGIACITSSPPWRRRSAWTRCGRSTSRT